MTHLAKKIKAQQKAIEEVKEEMILKRLMISRKKLEGQSRRLKA